MEKNLLTTLSDEELEHTRIHWIYRLLSELNIKNLLENLQNTYTDISPKRIYKQQTTIYKDIQLY